MVEHDEKLCVFKLSLDNGKAALLNYRVNSDEVWDCYHTEVPSEYQGRGLGGVLAKVS